MLNIAILSTSRLFHGIPSAEIPSLLDQVSWHLTAYHKNETVFHLMDDADQIAIILNGRVQVQKIFPSGDHMHVTVKQSGDMLGEAAVFSVQKKYPCELIALEESELLMLNRENMLKLLQTDIRLMDHFLSELATHTYQLQQRIELLSYSSIRQKIAYYLLSQSMQSGSNTVRIPESVTKWALNMNVSRTSLHRELSAMIASGLIRYEAPLVAILNRERLQSILE